MRKLLIHLIKSGFLSTCIITNYIVSDGLVFPVIFLFHHKISELPRPITVKLCHMIGNWLNFIMQVRKFRGTLTQKIWGQRHAKFRSILYSFRL